MTMIHKLISAWMLALVGSLLLPLMSLAAVSGATCDVASTTTTAPATIAQHRSALATVCFAGTSLQSKASGQSRSLLPLSPSFLTPKSIKTPYGSAVQENSAAALRVRSQVQQGGTVYKAYGSSNQRRTDYHYNSQGLLYSIEKPTAVVKKLTEMRLRKAAEAVEQSVEETLIYMSYPQEHWLRIKTNNPLERIMREIRRRTRVVWNFPDGRSALMLVAARLRHIAGTKWGLRRYLNMDRLYELEKQRVSQAA